MSWLRLRRQHSRWTPDLIGDWPVFQQLKQEAGIKGSVTDTDFDKLLAAAGARGLGVVYDLERI